MVKTSVEAFAPATVANLGVGFDILGMALQEPGDVVRAERRDEPGASIQRIEGDGGKLPYDAERNTACVAANEVLKQIGAVDGVNLTIFKNLPLASGLGSSAASAVAAAVAVNDLYGEPLSREELLPACLAGEAAVSGRHADNVAPCLFGGITLVGGASTDIIRQLPIPDRLYVVLVTPDVEVPTALARSVLPDAVMLRDMVMQTFAVARLVDALHRGDLADMASAMEQDCVVEPARARLMPMLPDLRHAARQAGALGLVISGAGPTLCAICDAEETALAVSEAMQFTYIHGKITSSARVTRISEQGARILASG